MDWSHNTIPSQRCVRGNGQTSSSVRKKILLPSGARAGAGGLCVTCPCRSGREKDVPCNHDCSWGKLRSAAEERFMKKAILCLAASLILGVGEFRAQTTPGASLTVIRAGTLIDGSSDAPRKN